jgi:hypothetical protein
MKRAITILGFLGLAQGYLILGGCGGSGSSGFDNMAGNGPSAFNDEQAAIEQVTQEGGCVEVDGTTICAPGAPVPETVLPAQPDSDSSTTSADAPVSGSQITCEPVGDEKDCGFTVGIIPSGYPEDTAFIAAVRLQDASSSWVLASAPFAPSSSDPARLESNVQIAELSVGDAAQVQIAVLVFLPGHGSPLPGAIEQLLRDFQADVVFVMTDITVQAAAPS